MPPYEPQGGGERVLDAFSPSTDHYNSNNTNILWHPELSAYMIVNIYLFYHCSLDVNSYFVISNSLKYDVSMIQKIILFAYQKFVKNFMTPYKFVS